MTEPSNTWEYRFAFRIRSEEDVPVEFRSTFRDLTRGGSDPALAFFSPALKEGHYLTSRWTPPRLWLVFPDSLAVLSLDLRSDAVSKFLLQQSDLLGFGHAEFLLNCWFSIFPGPDNGGPFEIRFPSRAEEKYQDLLRMLTGWCCKDNAGLRNRPSESRLSLAGLPPKFEYLLERYPETGPILEMFYQPRMIFGRRKAGEWPNVLFLLTPNLIIVLSDEYRGRWSEFGVRSLYFPLARLKLAEWVDGSAPDCGQIRIHLEGASRQTSVSWPFFRGLKPYARRLLEAIEVAQAVLLRNRDQAGHKLPVDFNPGLTEKGRSCLMGSHLWQK
jgi:hypothetical protein